MLQSIKFFLFIVFFALIFTQSYSQVIPPENRIDWSQAGCRFFLPDFLPEVSILSFGGSNNGVDDNVNALNTAMANFDGHPGRVYFPSGSYLFASTISMPDSIVLSGAGSDSTFIKIGHSSIGFSFSGSAANAFTNIVYGFQKGSQKITVSDPSLFTAGKYCEIRQDNGSWDTNPAVWADFSVGQMVQIQSIIADTLVLFDFFHLDYDTALNLQIQQIHPCSASSISCLNVQRTDVSTTATGYNFAFNYAVNCEIAGIESNKSQGSHCIIGASSHVSVSGCYFHDAYMYDGAGTKGYGVTLITHASHCLVQNNIFNHLRHAMMTKQGANGNVFGYNYSINPFRNGYMEYPQNYCGDISLHGHYSFANLFEGNIVQTIYTDQTWGPSGPYNTLFRNRVELYGIIMTSSLTNKQNIVGNEITGTGSTWPFNHGAYSIVGTGHIQFGNNKNGVIVPDGTFPLTDISYYLDTQPLYWNVNQTWPNIGIPNALSSGTIPAKERFLAGNFTDCSHQGIITDFQEKESSKFLVYPNPATDKSFVQFADETFCKNINISSIEGKTLIHIQPVAGESKTEIDLSSLKPGIYLLSAETKTGIAFMKIIKD
ncbi:MAG: glycosyl hydrolase family 28-related protein [Bacteroidales bacterium]